MPRKIFLSFLGAVKYLPTCYYFQDDRENLSPEVYYVQELILRRHNASKAFLFVTGEALTNNYENRIDVENKQPILLKGEGVASILEKLTQDSLLGDYEYKNIPNGNSQAEMWEIFKTVYDTFEEYDEVVVDVTFGFRSLPMLMIVLLNYAKALKNIEIKAIYYGNYEAGRQEKEALIKLATTEEEKQKAEKRSVEAPILDLITFAELQAWTYAAQSFAVGNAQPLSKITEDSHPDFSHDIEGFAKAIQTCRGLELSSHIDIDRLKDQVHEMAERSDIEVVLRPLLDKVAGKLAPFRSNQLSNGFAAVEWCIQHNLVQQGITFLQETLQSYVVESVLGTEHITNRAYRFAANGALGGFSSPRRTIEEAHKDGLPVTDEEIEQTYQAMYNLVRSKRGLFAQYRILTGDMRNDINHGGYRDEYMSADELKERLKGIYEQVTQMNL